MGGTLWTIVKDKYLTWKTGHTTEQRAYLAWCKENLGLQNDIKAYFYKFKHIIEVDHDKVYGYDIGYYTKAPFRLRYQFPNRELGDNTMLYTMRGEYDQYNICVDNCFGGDHCYAATNNDEDAIMIALKYK